MRTTHTIHRKTSNTILKIQNIYSTGKNVTRILRQCKISDERFQVRISNITDILFLGIPHFIGRKSYSNHIHQGKTSHIIVRMRRTHMNHSKTANPSLTRQMIYWQYDILCISRPRICLLSVNLFSATQLEAEFRQGALCYRHLTLYTFPENLAVTFYKQ